MKISNEEIKRVKEELLKELPNITEADILDCINQNADFITQIKNKTKLMEYMRFRDELIYIDREFFMPVDLKLVYECKAKTNTYGYTNEDMKDRKKVGELIARALADPQEKKSLISKADEKKFKAELAKIANPTNEKAAELFLKMFPHLEYELEKQKALYNMHIVDLLVEFKNEFKMHMFKYITLKQMIACFIGSRLGNLKKENIQFECPPNADENTKELYTHVKIDNEEPKFTEYSTLPELAQFYAKKKRKFAEYLTHDKFRF
ncbi:MAG: hypothetical protein FWH03_06375 [Firmicutes bacterium]|nr:hypothetical protein [Bacillota bacterium]